MITYNDLREAQDFIVDKWGGNGEKVIAEAIQSPRFDGNVNAFLDNCVTCGGNWGGMFLSGIKKLYPKVYNLIPEDMGNDSFLCICYLLMLLGVDTSN